MTSEKIVKGKELPFFKRITLGDLLNTATIADPEVVAAAYRKPGENEFTKLTYREFSREIKELALGLIALGLEKGDRISILSETRYEWPLADFAILTTGGVTVTIYHTLSSPSIEYILNDSGSKLIFVDNQERLDKVLEVKKNIPHLEYIINIDPLENPHENIYSLEELKKLGAKNEQNSLVYEERQHNIKPDDFCSIIYSSGTTGNPKGVMLTHWNLISITFGLKEVLDYKPGDIMLGFLPFAHVGMRANFLCSLIGRLSCYFSVPEKLSEDISLIRPVAMAAVPRLWERVYDRLIEKVESSGILRRKIFYWAAGVARDIGETRSKNKEPSRGLQFKHRLADRLVFRKIRIMGGLERLRTCVSGAASLRKELAYFFNGIGLPLLETYGLTETAGPVNIVPSNKFRPGSVGPPIPGITEKIAEDGELLIKGDGIMQGYYNLPEETKEAITEDGWLKSGDIGFFDDEGYFFYKERKKHILVLSTGKNVAPLPIEEKLRKSPWIEEAIVLGDNRKYIAALIQPEFKKLVDFAEENKVNFDRNLTEYTYTQVGEKIPAKVDPSLFKDEKVANLYKKEVEEANYYFNNFEQVKRFILIEEAVSLEGGELTPTLKVKKHAVENKYADRIEDLYKNEKAKQE